MNLRKLTMSSLLLSIGMILRYIAPPILFGMKPDIALGMMFIAILLADDYKITLIVGLAAGLLAAATTNFPGGQIPNVIDKLITCNIVYFIILTLKKILNHQILIGIVSLLGTVISGTIFLASASVIVGLPGGASFTTLFLTVVLPATLVNTIACMFLYNAVYLANKRIAHLK
jgi:hypothetical protein